VTPGCNIFNIALLEQENLGLGIELSSLPETKGRILK
jgi:hypothetical protein